jgi:nucleotide-binding universal stress UspA family protein
MKPFAKILVPIDFSRHSNEALATAADLARRYGASITLLHVVDTVPLQVFPDSAEGLPYEAAMREVASALDTMKDELASQGVAHVDVQQRRGHPPTEILELARSYGSDLIVMGTLGRTGITHWLLGSVAERVVRTAPCSVLTVHAS